MHSSSRPSVVAKNAWKICFSHRIVPELCIAIIANYCHYNYFSSWSQVNFVEACSLPLHVGFFHLRFGWVRARAQPAYMNVIRVIHETAKARIEIMTPKLLSSERVYQTRPQSHNHMDLLKISRASSPKLLCCLSYSLMSVPIIDFYEWLQIQIFAFN